MEMKERDSVGEWMLSTNKTKAPSLLQKLCFCQSGPSERKPSGIETVPHLRGLAGVTVQAGTRGALQTLKWAKWDAAKRQVDIKVFGGFTDCGGNGGSEVGLWSETVEAQCCFLPQLFGRCGNCTYRFTFSEDYRRADIAIMGNVLVCCCICIPCLPVMCSVPKCCFAFEMVQTDNSTDGTSWNRNTSTCGSDFQLSYHLKEVYTPEGEVGKYHDELKEQPQQVMVTY